MTPGTRPALPGGAPRLRAPGRIDASAAPPTSGRYKRELPPAVRLRRSAYWTGGREGRAGAAPLHNPFMNHHDANVESMDWHPLPSINEATPQADEAWTGAAWRWCA